MIFFRMTNWYGCAESFVTIVRYKGVDDVTEAPYSYW